MKDSLNKKIQSMSHYKLTVLIRRALVTIDICSGMRMVDVATKYNVTVVRCAQVRDAMSRIVELNKNNKSELLKTSLECLEAAKDRVKLLDKQSNKEDAKNKIGISAAIKLLTKSGYTVTANK